MDPISFYNGKKKQTKDERKLSPIYDIRVFNNFLKSTLIASNLEQKKNGKCVVLDLCGGTFGDLPKFQNASNVKEVIVVDASEESLKEARRRFEQPPAKKFDAHFVHCDAFDFDKMELALGNGMKEGVDFINCQFALHYAAKTNETLDEAMKTASYFLKTGSVMCCTFPSDEFIIGSLNEKGKIKTPMFEIEFLSDTENSYLFSMGEAVHRVPEFILFQSSLRDAALKWGMEIQTWTPFQDLFTDTLKNNKYADLSKKLNCFHPSSNAWDTAQLYVAVEIIKK